MNRPARPVTAALAASAALLLTACGSGKAETPSASPSAPAAPSAAAGETGRPEIKLPSDMKLHFEGQQTGDATKDAILADNARTVSTVWQAVAYGDLKKSGMGFYYTDTALRAVYDYAKNNNANKTSWAGTLRYFDRQVTVFDKATAALTYCVDESNANVKDLKTNKVNVVETSPESYVYYNTGVKKDKEGVWHIWQLHEDRGSKRCQP